MTENTDEQRDAPYADAIPEETEDELMTEQIEASFGPMTVYVSGTDTEDVQDTFDHVWDRMMETSDKMREMKDDDDTIRGGGFN